VETNYKKQPACISTDNVERVDQQEHGQYQAWVPTPNINRGTQLEDSYFQACISTDSVERVDQQEDGQYQEWVPTPNINRGAQLEDSRIEACIWTSNVDTQTKVEDSYFQACISTPNVDTPVKQEDKHGDCKLELRKGISRVLMFPSARSVFNLSGLGESKPQDKAAECILQITPEYLQKINKHTKKQKNLNRRLRKQITELTEERVETEETKPLTKPDV